MSKSLPLIYTLDDIKEALEHISNEEIIDAMCEAFTSLSSGKFNLPPVQTMGCEPFAPFQNKETQTCVKSGYITGGDTYVVKVASGPPNSGNMQVYSQQDGKLIGLLLDEGLLTELRTAAASAMASSLLKPDRLDSIGIIGTGVQARFQLRFLKSITSCRQVKIYGRDQTRLKIFIDEMKADGWHPSASSIQDMVQTCQLIHTVTSSREPLIQSSMIPTNRRIHFTCVGADAQGKQELDPEIIKQADFIVTDTRAQTGERGEFQHAIKAGLVSIDDITEIGEILQNSSLNKRLSNINCKISVFDTSGVAIQDVKIASMLLNSLRLRGCN